MTEQHSNALLLHPLLYAWTLPLLGSVGFEAFRDGITVHDQAVEHQRQIGISNAPVAKKVCGLRGQQLLGHLEQFVCSCLRGGAQGRRRRLDEYRVHPALDAYRQEIAAQPGLDLSGTGAKV